jgi:hypothetical protein
MAIEVNRRHLNGNAPVIGGELKPLWFRGSGHSPNGHPKINTIQQGKPFKQCESWDGD